MALEDPGPVVLVLEGLEGAAEVLDDVEAPEPEQVLLQDADAALDAPLALGFADERRRAREAEEVELAPEVVGDEPAAVIVAQPGAGVDAVGEGDEAVVHGLAQRLQGLEARGPAGGMDAQALAGPVIDDDEDGGLALAGEGRGQIRAPPPRSSRDPDRVGWHLVDARGADG